MLRKTGRQTAKQTVRKKNLSFPFPILSFSPTYLLLPSITGTFPCSHDAWHPAPLASCGGTAGSREGCCHGTVLSCFCSFLLALSPPLLLVSSCSSALEWVPIRLQSLSPSFCLGPPRPQSLRNVTLSGWVAHRPQSLRAASL